MLHPQSRRPRFERAPVRKILLTARDRQILRAVHHHRLLRSMHLAALAGGSRQATLRRLQLLFHHGYLDRPPMQLDWYTRGSEPMVYALGKLGAEVLAGGGELRRGGVRWDTKNRRLSRVFLRHTLAVADVMVAFELVCRGHEGVTFIPSEEILAGVPERTRRLRLPFRWQVDVRFRGKLHRLGVEPDRVFGLRFMGLPKNRSRAYFFLEADRGTMPVTRKTLAQTSLSRKLLAYDAIWRQGVHRTHLGIPNFRVLTVTSTPDRVQHLLDACRSMPRGAAPLLFLFTDRGAFHPGDPIDGWLNARGQTTRLDVLAP